MKKIIKNIYKKFLRIPILFKFRYSNFGWTIYYFIFRELGKANSNEFDNYKKALEPGKGNLAFDIGAHTGQNTKHLLRLGYKVIALEPETLNYGKLNSRFKHNPNIITLKVGVGNKNEELNLYLSDLPSRHTLSKNSAINLKSGEKINVWTISKLINEYGIPYLIKVDVEGYEKEVLTSLVTPIKQIIFEANLPTFFEETIQIIEHLNRMGDYKFKLLERTTERFMNAKEIKNFLKSLETRSIDIYCKIIEN